MHVDASAPHPLSARLTSVPGDSVQVFMDRHGGDLLLRDLPYTLKLRLLCQAGRKRVSSSGRHSQPHLPSLGVLKGKRGAWRMFPVDVLVKSIMLCSR